MSDLVVSLVVGTVTSIVVARGLGPGILGQYQFVVWMASIVSTISLYGVPIAAARNIGQFLAAGEVGLAGAVLRRTLVVQSAIALGAFALGIALVRVLLPSGEQMFGTIAFLAILPALFMAIPTALNALDDRFSRNVVPSMTGAVVECAGAIAVVGFDLGLVGLASASLFARSIDCVLRTAGAWARMRALLRAAATLPPDVARLFHRMAKEAAAMQLLAFAVWNRSEILFLEWLSSPEQIAFFSLAYGLSTRVGTLPSASARTFMPAILRSYAADSIASTAIAVRAVRQQALIGYPLYGLLAICAEPLIRVMYGPEYLPAVPGVVVLAVATAFTMGRNSLEALLRAADRQRSMVNAYLVMTVLTLAADWVLVSMFAATGAAIANGAILVLQGGVLFALARRHTSLRWSQLAVGRPFALAVVVSAAAFTATLWCTPIVAIMARSAIVFGLYGFGLAWTRALLPDEDAKMRSIGRHIRSRFPSRQTGT